MNAESGWYPDSIQIGMERYWDGRAWTEESRWPGTDPYTTAVPPDLPPPEGVPFQSMFAGMPQASTVGFSLPREPVVRTTSESTSSELSGSSNGPTHLLGILNPRLRRLPDQLGRFTGQVSQIAPNALSSQAQRLHNSRYHRARTVR